MSNSSFVTMRSVHAPAAGQSAALDSADFAASLKRKIDAHLAHHKHSECPLTKKDILDLGQLQKEIQFQEDIQEVGVGMGCSVWRDATSLSPGQL